MGKIIEFPVARVQPSQPPPAAADGRGWTPLDAAAAAFGASLALFAAAALGASLALWHACTQASGSVGRGIGRAPDAPAEPSCDRHRMHP
jgi:hypothetical protein